jgi:excinuclease UvrABC nuclease subunit
LNINVNVDSTISFLTKDYKQALPELKMRKIGVYVFYDKHENPLYVGKSKILNTRVPSHINGTSNVKEIKKDAVSCIVYFISNPAMADIFETYLINEIKPMYNLDKASYSEFIKAAEEELLDIECRMLELEESLMEILNEDEDSSDLGESLYIAYEIKKIERKLAILERKRRVLKRRGAMPLSNITVEEIIEKDNKRKIAAYLSSRN